MFASLVQRPLVTNLLIGADDEEKIATDLCTLYKQVKVSRLRGIRKMGPYIYRMP